LNLGRFYGFVIGGGCFSVKHLDFSLNDGARWQPTAKPLQKPPPIC